MNDGKRHESMWIRIGKLNIKTDNIVMAEEFFEKDGPAGKPVPLVRLWHSFHVDTDGGDDTYTLDEAGSALFMTMLHSGNFRQWDFVLDETTPNIDDAYGPPG